MNDNRQRLILNVDDNDAGRYAVTRILQHAGFRVLEAATGRDALKMAEEQPDLILLDVKLPDISGLEVCRQIRSNPRTAALPVVHLSAAYVRTDDLASAMEQGADGYLTHPIDPKVLIATINAFLRLKAAEQRLRESEERFRSLYENSAIGLYRTTPEGRVILSNPALVKMLGYSSFEELAGRNIAKEGFASDSGRKEFVDRIESSGEIKEHESAWLRKDGSVLYVNESAKALRDARGVTLYYDGTVQDITERKKAEEQLRLSEQTYRGILNSISDAVYIKDEHGVYLDVNTAGEHMFGYTKEELLGQTYELLSLPGKNDPLLLKANMEKALAGEAQTFEFWGCRKDKTSFPLDVSYSPGEYFGRKVIIVVARDITERKAMDGLLRDVQRREAIGVMSSGIAHDFNNLLAAMMGNVSLAQMQLDAGHPIQSYLGHAMLAMETAAELVQQILAYTGKGKFQIRMIDLAAAIKEHVSLFRISTPKNVRLTTHLPSAPVYVAGDPGQIKQIIINLIMNGGEALGSKHGEVSVTLSPVRLDGAGLRTFTQFTTARLNEGGYALIEVRDNGMGMKPEILQKIFDPFYSTKFIGRGLGLAAVLGIIRSHEGGIAVESKEGAGTTFSVILPLAEPPKAAQADSPSAPPSSEGATTILVIDDEESIAMMAKEILELADYAVLTDLNPVTGIELFRQHRSEIGAVLLDLTMPEMSGKEVMDALLAIDPAVKIIISSGYSEQETSTKVDMTKVAGFMQKPYSVPSLLAMVKTVAEGR
ncbi:MAG: PAS domain S-box protein [Acidobacteriota bacterium]